MKEVIVVHLGGGKNDGDGGAEWVREIEVNVDGLCEGDGRAVCRGV